MSDIILPAGCFPTRMRRQWEEKSWCAGMVEKTERTRQLNTRMNLRMTRRKKEKKSETQTRSRLRLLYFPLRQTLEPELSLEENQNELAATSRG